MSSFLFSVSQAGLNRNVAAVEEDRHDPQLFPVSQAGLNRNYGPEVDVACGVALFPVSQAGLNGLGSAVGMRQALLLSISLLATRVAIG